MPYDPRRHHRRSTRLKGHDYAAPGAYFLTLCAHRREHLFGEVAAGGLRLNEYGRLVADEWMRTASVRPYVTLDAWVVMPNHIHGIVIINDMTVVGASRRLAPTTLDVDAGQHPPTPPDVDGDTPHGLQPGSIGAIMAQFKSLTTKHINAQRGTPGALVWQRGYYDHIVRTPRELDAIRRYIQHNPLKWDLDRDNAANRLNRPAPARLADYLDDLPD